MNNRIILEKIVKLERQKGIYLILEKVQSHSENKWNNEADYLAKLGRTSHISIDISESFSTVNKVKLKWKTYEIENSLKAFCTEIFKKYQDVEWALTDKAVNKERYN